MSCCGVFENDALELGLPSESHQQSDREPGCLQVVQQLRLMIGFERMSNLDFYDDDIIDKNVGVELDDASASKVPPGDEPRRRRACRDLAGSP